MNQIWRNEHAAVWLARLDEIAPADFFHLLSPDEIARVQTYGDPVLRSGFIVRRGLLRQLLTEQLGHSPDFIYTELKKPMLAKGELHFSIAKCPSLALFAISETHAVGVDVENVDRVKASEEFLRDHLTRAERLVVGEHVARAWVRKEACAKALGLGLSRPLSEYDVRPLDAPQTTVRAGGRILQVYDLPVPGGSVGAVAIALPNAG